MVSAMYEKRTIQSVARVIGRFFQEYRRMPSYQEMIEILGVRSKSVVHFWVNKLIAGGLVEKDPKGRLILTKRSFAIPMVGSVQAGFPSPEEEELRGGVIPKRFRFDPIDDIQVLSSMHRA
jgi:hypothetical protein